AARALKEQVLEARRRLLGAEHPDTTIAAWNYWLTLRAAGEQEAAARVFEECLRWLVERDPATLGVDQRKIRVMVADALRTFRG
ncbi:MAG: tetratricopeptide repeat protein, partial [Bryobacteraceae bacterium]|nr:tetratricopeptide repeat protein [Bryobacteraceae bacterium]